MLINLNIRSLQSTVDALSAGTAPAASVRPHRIILICNAVARRISKSLKKRVPLGAQLKKPDIHMVSPEVQAGPGGTRGPPNKRGVTQGRQPERTEAFQPQARDKTGGGDVGDDHIGNLGPV
jgi:hypothetical protein